jgi:hypothetical protein
MRAGDPTVRSVAWGVAGSTLALAAGSAALHSARFAVGVLLGGAVVALNFLVLAAIVVTLGGPRRQALVWGSVYLLKVAALFGAVAALLRLGWAHPLGVVVGLGALLPGIVVGGVVAAPDRGPEA